MNSRKRVLTTLAHQEPDRVPIDLGGTIVTGIAAVAYHRLKEHLKLKQSPIRIHDVGQQLAEVELEVLQRFGVDVMDFTLSRDDQDWLWTSWAGPYDFPVQIPSYVQIERRDDGWYMVEDRVRTRRMWPGRPYFDRIDRPLAEARTRRDIERFPWPRLTDEQLAFLQAQARWWHDNSDYALVGRFGGGVVEAGQDLRGWEQFLIDLVEGRPFVHDLMDRILEVVLENLELYLSAVGDYIHVIQMGDDLGTQQGPVMSPDMYRELIQPRHKRIHDYVHQHSDVRVFLHSCGSIMPLVPDLIEAGVDILNPVQVSARGMDPAMLKERFGDRLVFWGGGCDGQWTLPFGTPGQVRAQVQERLRIFAPGGGYVFAPVHNIQPDVPPENVVAMYDAVLEGAI